MPSKLYGLFGAGVPVIYVGPDRGSGRRGGRDGRRGARAPTATAPGWPGHPARCATIRDARADGRRGRGAVRRPLHARRRARASPPLVERVAMLNAMLTLTPVVGFALAVRPRLALTPMDAAHGRCALGAVDRRSDRKIHADDVPRLGGVAIAAAFYVPVLVLALRDNLFSGALWEHPGRISALLGGGAGHPGAGRLRRSARRRRAEEAVGADPRGACAGLVGRASASAGPPCRAAPPDLLAGGCRSAATVVWLVVVINAINLIDGLDGLASGIALQALVATALCAWHRDEPVLALLVAVPGRQRRRLPGAQLPSGDGVHGRLGQPVPRLRPRRGVDLVVAEGGPRSAWCCPRWCWGCRSSTPRWRCGAVW